MTRHLIECVPPDFGSTFNRWSRDSILQLHERLRALEAAVASGRPATGAPEDTRPLTKAHVGGEIAFPDWMRPHKETKRKLPEKLKIMGFLPTKEQTLEKSQQLKPGVKYTKKTAAGVWSCSEKVAGCWFFFLNHAVSMKYDDFNKSYTIQNE